MFWSHLISFIAGAIVATIVIFGLSLCKIAKGE